MWLVYCISPFTRTPQPLGPMRLLKTCRPVAMVTSRSTSHSQRTRKSLQSWRTCAKRKRRSPFGFGAVSIPLALKVRVTQLEVHTDIFMWRFKVIQEALDRYCEWICTRWSMYYHSQMCNVNTSTCFEIENVRFSGTCHCQNGLALPTDINRRMLHVLQSSPFSAHSENVSCISAFRKELLFRCAHATVLSAMRSLCRRQNLKANGEICGGVSVKQALFGGSFAEIWLKWKFCN